MRLWKYNKVTGLWNYVREVSKENALKWLSVFENYEPDETFKLSKRKPK